MFKVVCPYIIAENPPAPETVGEPGESGTRFVTALRIGALRNLHGLEVDWEREGVQQYLFVTQASFMSNWFLPQSTPYCGAGGSLDALRDPHHWTYKVPGVMVWSSLIFTLLAAVEAPQWALAGIRLLGLHYLIAKLAAALCTFVANFLARRQLLFVPSNNIPARAEDG